MVFPPLVTVETTEVALEVIAAAFALVRPVGGMFLMSMGTSATGTPLVDIKSFTTGHPPLAYFLRATGDEGEGLAFASFTRGVGLLLA
jgi:hypothetical protein